MHTISIQASSNGYRWKCSCGQFGNEYGTEQHAREVGLRHKQYAEEEKPDYNRDDKHLGY